MIKISLLAECVLSGLYGGSPLVVADSSRSVQYMARTAKSKTPHSRDRGTINCDARLGRVAKLILRSGYYAKRLEVLLNSGFEYCEQMGDVHGNFL